MNVNTNFADIRKEYKLKFLLEEDADPDPIKQFQKWWSDALNSNVKEPNAMTLATADENAKPSARTVLLKGLSNEGFVFFTNYKSRKAKELNENPHAYLLFFWKELERQVRIEGKVKKIDEKKSDEYFLSRPKASQIGSWSSPQSQVIKSRSILDKNVEKYEKKFITGKVVRPAHWGGYVVTPSLIEFWQGRPNRLHDRLQYTLTDKKEWKLERLAP